MSLQSFRFGRLLVLEVGMYRKILLGLIVAATIALIPAEASARGGFGGGGFHGGGFHGGFAGGGFRGGGFGGGWRGGGWRGGGWGGRGPAFGVLGVGVGLGLANAAWGGGGPGWGGPGWGYSGWDDGCTRLRQVWTGWGWRLVPVNVCW
jgi:hypothetical protein